MTENLHRQLSILYLNFLQILTKKNHSHFRNFFLCIFVSQGALFTFATLSKRHRETRTAMSLKCMRERELQRWEGGHPERSARERLKQRVHVCVRERSDDRLFFTFPLLTADVISHSPRTHSRSNLRLLWTALLKPHNQMKTFITYTLHRLYTHICTHACRTSKPIYLQSKWK